MKILKIQLTNKLDGEVTIHEWKEKKNEDYAVFMWKQGYMQCDCNRSMFRYGYHECYPCNSNDSDRIFKVKIYNEQDEVIYEEA